MFTTIAQLYLLYQKHPSITTDSRKVTKGQLFFALKGPSFDGNKYAAAALEKGAAYSITDDATYQTNDRCLLVEDVLTSLQDLARHHRQQLAVPVIGITGSNGKTTTKELIMAVLSSTYRTQATKGNLNNHIGVPLTLLSFQPDIEMAVVEMGANHINEIADLCQIALPNYGLLTSIGKAHLEGFGSIEGVVKAKGELFDFITEHDGTAFVNLNDARISNMAFSLPNRSTYGSNVSAKVNGEVAVAEPYLGVKWVNAMPEKNLTINTQLTGTYNLDNVLAAIAIGSYFNISPQTIKTAIEAYMPSNNRSQVMQKNSNTYVLDAYNANPSSMKAALQNFEQLVASQKVVILGDMLELGQYSLAEHQEIVNRLAAMKLTQVVLVGEEFEKTNMPSGFLHFKRSQNTKEWFAEQAFTNTHFLIKGSRGIALEKVIA